MFYAVVAGVAVFVVAVWWANSGRMRRIPDGVVSAALVAASADL
jgi:hypothetical protein